MIDFIKEFSDIIIYALAVVIFYAIFKFLFLLIRYFIFKKFVNLLVDQIYDEEDSGSEEKFTNPKSNKEDEVKKDKEFEKQKEIEEKIEILNNKNKNQKQEARITGVKIYGPWTAKVVKSFLGKFAGLNKEDLQKDIFKLLFWRKREEKKPEEALELVKKEDILLILQNTFKDQLLRSIDILEIFS